MRGKKTKALKTATRPNPGRKYGGLLKAYNAGNKPDGQEKPGTSPPTLPIERTIDE